MSEVKQQVFEEKQGNSKISVAMSVQSTTANMGTTLVILQQLLSQHRIKSVGRKEIGKGNR